MTRFVLAVFGVVLIALLGLTSLWLLGQLLSGLGNLVVAAAALLGGVLRFVVVAGVLAGLTYVLTSAWGQPQR